LYADAKDNYRPLLIRAERKCLQTGDYSIIGHEHEIAIERKSIEDLYSTVAGRRANFKAEHERMAEMVRAGGFACVIVEDELVRGFKEPPLHTNLLPKVLFRTMIRWSMRYRVPWHFAGSRHFAAVLAFRMLHTWYDFTQEGTTNDD
jgi:ERCC4-type nuclease